MGRLASCFHQPPAFHAILSRYFETPAPSLGLRAGARRAEAMAGKLAP